MPDLSRILVVANRTSESPELLAALRERAEHGPIEVTLVVPATWEVSDAHGGIETANRRMCSASERMRGLGIHVAGIVGDPDPFVAFTNAWDPAAYDEVIVCTLRNRLSEWLKRDLPRRVDQAVGTPVTHIIGTEAGLPLPA
ncbi:MAG TPA: hypothetical protein VFZ89_13065 [Solirubrobacteraceae bacterium]